MEQNFQTSFIPKKPIIKERAVSSRPVGPLVVIALFILFTVLIAWGGLYFYKGLTAKNIESMKEDHRAAEARQAPARRDRDSLGPCSRDPYFFRSGKSNNENGALH